MKNLREREEEEEGAYRLADVDELRDFGSKTAASIERLRPRPLQIAVDNRSALGVKRGCALQECNGRQRSVIRRTLRHGHLSLKLFSTNRSKTGSLSEYYN